MIQMLQEAAEGYGAEIMVKTPAKSLITGEDGGIIGVVAEKDGVDVNFKANLGVVVTTGGFDFDEEMTKNFLRGPIYFSIAVSTNTGDGQKMGMKAGAALANMNECWGAPGYLHEDYGTYIVDWVMERGKPGAIIVNREGKRFLNESAAYDPTIRPFYHYDTGTYEYKNIPGFTIIDSEFRNHYTLLYTPIGTDLPGFVARGDTLAELAENLGIDPQGLEETVAQFNTYAEEGVDPDFHRGEYPLDTSTGGDPSRTDLKNVCLAPLATPPFYGLAIWPGTIGTNGGLKINKDAQVIDAFGQPITGLYAAGNAAGSPFGAGYPTGGCTVGSGLVFSYQAANHIISRKEL
jgi:succinate dehydrogenase/fumarate reductase flavoprotein subunit